MSREAPDWRHAEGECYRMPHRCNTCPHPHIGVERFFAVWSAYGDALIGQYATWEEARAAIREMGES